MEYIRIFHTAISSDPANLLHNLSPCGLVIRVLMLQRISGYRPYGVASHNCVFSAAIRMHCILPIPPALRAVNIGCCGRSLLYLCRTGKLDTGVVGVGSVYRCLAFTLADQVVTIGSSGEVVIVFSLSSP